MRLSPGALESQREQDLRREAAALERARRRALGAFGHVLEATVQGLVQAGWTATAYACLTEFAAHAIATGSYPYAGYPSMHLPDAALRHVSLEETERMQVTARLARIAELTVRQRHARCVAVLGWLRVHAGEPVPRLAIKSVLKTSISKWSRDGEWGVPVAEWTDQVGPLAPVAWAAGLTLDEAVGRRADDDLDVESLLTLASLRGYRLPPLPLGMHT